MSYPQYSMTTLTIPAFQVFKDCLWNSRFSKTRMNHACNKHHSIGNYDGLSSKTGLVRKYNVLLRKYNILRYYKFYYLCNISLNDNITSPKWLVENDIYMYAYFISGLLTEKNVHIFN